MDNSVVIEASNILNICLRHLSFITLLAMGSYFLERNTSIKGFILGAYIGLGVGAFFFMSNTAYYMDNMNPGAAMMYLQLSASAAMLIHILHKTAKVDPVLNRKNNA